MCKYVCVCSGCAFVSMHRYVWVGRHMLASVNLCVCVCEIMYMCQHVCARVRVHVKLQYAYSHIQKNELTDSYILAEVHTIHMFIEYIHTCITYIPTMRTYIHGCMHECMYAYIALHHITLHCGNIHHTPHLHTHTYV